MSDVLEENDIDLNKFLQEYLSQIQEGVLELKEVANEHNESSDSS